MRLKIISLCLTAFLMMGTAAYASTPYTVKSGDTLWKVSQQHHTSFQTFWGMNRFSGSMIFPGQVVYIPTSAKTYRVKSGDTLYKISSASNVSLWALEQVNPQLKKNSSVYPGQILDLPATTQAKAPNQPTVGAYASQVAALVNKERQKAGLAPLTLDAELSRVAFFKAKDMIDKNYFNHNSPTYGSPFDMMRSFGISYTAAGENIAKGQSNPNAVMTDWMNSPGHRENILSSSYDTIGVAYYQGAWVQMFIK